ncbi:unnamed protein product [Kluyveromyces dobzhanskii CBS 2104]|uniref:Protein YAE1 n=1 Tax=Kluyveromyces dobzhanskii CBS 2104 TaxID=1427455 RepID=A0A0A8LA72_9SACH|nr:unnamed protein product [Kluyveromyces dobzhanskii CBS 2104]
MTVEMSDNEDVWGSDSEFMPGSEESPELNKLRQVHSKRGYLDGISSAKEENLQAGFDATFPMGSQYGFQIGLLVGKLQLLATLYGKSDLRLLEDMKQVQKELRINKVLADKHFDENLKPLDSLDELLCKWQLRLSQYEVKYSI